MTDKKPGTTPANPAGGSLATNQDELILYAHRGSSLLAPENTMPAFELALTHGADVMEIDVRLSSDGELIVIHDERLDRTCNAQGRVRDMSLKELKRLDAGYHFTDLDGRNHRNAGTRLITLAEMFERLPQTAINIDIKDNSREAAEAVAAVMQKAERIADINVGSFHAPALAYFRQAMPQASTAATQMEVAQLYFKRGLYRNTAFQYLQIPVQYFGIPLATRDFIRHATQRGIKTVYWTINDRRSMERLISRNVTGFVTDRVDIAGALLGKSPIPSWQRA